MEKILVTTDLSVNSAAAILFAYKLSQLKGATLVILHVYHILRPKSWRSRRFENYNKAREEFLLTKLNKFLHQIFSAVEAPEVNFEIDLQRNSNTVNTVLKCVAKHKCTYMCISTQGTGKLKKAIDPLVSKLITKAPIPIFTIPSSYKLKKIKSICYASDLINHQKEIKKIIEFAKTLNIEIRLLHIVSPTETVIRATLLQARLLRRTGIEIKTKYVARTPTNTIIEDIDIAIKKIKPSLVVFFINRSRRYLNSILFPADTHTFSIFNKIPVLVYKK